MPSWTDIKSSWSSAWTGLQERASGAYQSAIQADPSKFKDTVASFMASLSESRASLDRIQALLKQVDDPALAAKAGELESRYATLASGVYADAKPADTIGVAPVVVGGVVDHHVGLLGPELEVDPVEAERVHRVQERLPPRHRLLAPERQHREGPVAVELDPGQRVSRTVHQPVRVGVARPCERRPTLDRLEESLGQLGFLG